MCVRVCACMCVYVCMCMGLHTNAYNHMGVRWCGEKQKQDVRLCRIEEMEQDLMAYHTEMSSLKSALDKLTDEYTVRPHCPLHLCMSLCACVCVHACVCMHACVHVCVLVCGHCQTISSHNFRSGVFSCSTDD